MCICERFYETDRLESTVEQIDVLHKNFEVASQKLRDAC